MVVIVKLLDNHALSLAMLEVKCAVHSRFHGLLGGWRTVLLINNRGLQHLVQLNLAKAALYIFRLHRLRLYYRRQRFETVGSRSHTCLINDLHWRLADVVAWHLDI